MGKIMVIGKAERKYSADLCNVNLEVETTRKTANEASKASSEQCERLLSKLQELGIEPDRIEIHYDQVDRKSDYHSNEISYESRKSLWLHIPADMQLVNAIRSIIEAGFEDISFSTLYSVSNEIALNRQLLKEAISDSRNKADLLASSMGLKITGVDSANLSGDEDAYDLAKDEEEEYDRVCYARKAASGYPLSDKLKPNEVELNAAVKIVWLIE